MADVNLAPYKPAPGDTSDANEISNAFDVIQAALNDIEEAQFAAGKIFSLDKLQQDGAASGQALVWNGTDWAAATVVQAPFGARVTNTTNTAIGAGGTKLPFDTEDFDTDTIHDNATNNTRLTCKTAGKYLIVVNVNFDSNLAVADDIELLLNNTTVIDESQANGLSIHFSTIYALAVNDYVEVRAFNSTGGARNALAAGTSFAMMRLAS